MAARPSRSPVTPERVVTTALELTREHGIDGWSLRDLATALDTWPNTITHHVGTREQVCVAVVDRVVAEMTNPPADLPWQEWFRTFLTDGRTVLRRYRGVALRLSRDGAGVPAAMPIMERGVTLLLDAGFGADAPRAYSLLLNSAILLVALGDERTAAGVGAGDVPARMRKVAPAPGTAPAWEAMHAYFDTWSEDAEAASAAVFDFNLDRVLAGLEASLPTTG
ncbi:TetR/AcrR family transcriptional regulator C-terminal domain-containing protein [Nocardioides sp. WV_118_6]|uniref:TetR/AcrR family transcriptional regulator n=1 Tax=Nocardioides simplex TaxID=2045 RepID=UPI0021500C2E|nr:TetR/AcrR family transcriptional regulator C-terminal domain-containing protein [Pimelobacter simplex]UUW91303.1 TetR/AcrR family transcriptional regulator C-terminal domain-containing protein [Pimelobacter simplex]UUW95131.1 TetR/AcrR family transcriptional regulator C-terminal domain-containing protein [Pimelobacter simplex]